MSEKVEEANDFKAFFEALNAQEKALSPRVTDDSLGVILRIAVNELDWYSYNLARASDPTFDQEEYFYLLHIGVTRLIKLALETRTSFDAPTIMYRRTPEIILPALEVAGGLGMIEHGRRIAQNAMAGVGRVQQTAISEFVITLPAILPDSEYHERELARYFYTLARQDLEETYSSGKGQGMAAEVSQLLTDLVYPFMEHFIGYDSALPLDLHFFAVASRIIQMKEGYDAFHYGVTFGGVTFLKYLLSLIFLVSLAIRHEQSAEALVRKVPTIRLENVLTISSEISTFVQEMQDALNLFGMAFEGFETSTTEEVSTIFKVLSVGHDSFMVLDRPGSALPLIIRTSSNDCIRCQTSILGNPIQFLLDSLRHNFPGDYDKNQLGREKAMQSAFRRICDGVIPGLIYRENIHIRRRGQTETDIDLVVMQPDTGIVLLVQLKYQDTYGMDIHSRHAKTKRLKGQTENWLSSMGDWIERSTHAEIKSTLRLPPTFPTPVFRRVIVARHFGYPVANVAREADVAYANWNQFYNASLLVAHGHVPPNLIKLTDALNAAQLHDRLPLHEEPCSEWIINELKFTTLQEGTPRSSTAPEKNGIA